MADRAGGLVLPSQADRCVPLPTGTDSRTPVIVLTGTWRAGIAALAGGSADGRTKPNVVVLNDTPRHALVADQPPARTGFGCPCCAIEDGLQRTLRALLSRARRGEISHVVVQASEAADPLTILTTLIVDEALAAAFRIGGVVVAIDALDPGLGGLTGPSRRQVIVADSLVIGGDPAVLDPVVRACNPAARIAWGLPDPGFLLADDRFGPPPSVQPQGSSVLAVTADDPLDWSALCRWLTADGPKRDGFVRSNHGDAGQAWRITGVVDVVGAGRPVAIEAVRHRLAPPRLSGAWADGQPRRSRLLFMGDALDASAITAALQSCSVRSPAARG